MGLYDMPAKSDTSMIVGMEVHVLNRLTSLTMYAYRAPSIVPA